MAKGKHHGKPVSDELAKAAAELFPDVKLNGGPAAAKKRAFLMALATSGQMVKAADQVGVSHYLPYLWMKGDAAFAEAVELAKSIVIDRVEGQAFELAANGYLEAVWSQGIHVGDQQKWLPTLMLALLNAWRSEKYKYRAGVEHTISDSMRTLQEEWIRLRDVPPPSRRELPSVNIIDMEEEVEEPRPASPVSATRGEEHDER
jgi:hypothetical protein